MLIFIVDIMLEDGVKIRKGLWFWDELSVRAGIKGWCKG